MAIVNVLRDWKIKIQDEKEKIMEFEFKEMKIMLTYFSIMQNACTQFGGHAALSAVMAVFSPEWKYFVVLGMVLAFFLFIVYPLYFGNKKMQAMKRSIPDVIAERERLYRSCIGLMSEYDNMCAVASPYKDAQDLLFKEVGDFEMKKFKNFRSENADLVYQTKNYQKFLLVIGIVGLINAVIFISYVWFQAVPVSPGVPIKPSESAELVLSSAAALTSQQLLKARQVLAMIYS